MFALPAVLLFATFIGALVRHQVKTHLVAFLVVHDPSHVAFGVRKNYLYMIWSTGIPYLVSCCTLKNPYQLLDLGPKMTSIGFDGAHVLRPLPQLLVFGGGVLYFL